MALTISPTASTPKQIALSLAGAAGTVLYKVPAGRTFTGAILPTVGVASGCQINGVALTISTNAATSATPIPVTLLAGAVVAVSGTLGGVLVGVEQ